MKRASITKRPYTYKGKTEDRWVVLWTDTKGKRREKWLPNKRHAEAYASKIDRELADNIHVADRSTITLGKACGAWLKKCEERHQRKNRDLAGATLERYKYTCRNHILPRFENVKLNKIRSVDVQNLIDEKAKTYEHGTVANISVIMWMIFEYAVEQELLPRNPLKDRRVKVSGEGRKRTAPSFEDVRQFLGYYFGPRPFGIGKRAWSNRRVIAVLTTFCGLRIGECLGLQWPNVKLDRNEIWVRNSLSKYDGLKDPKSKAGNRDIPMNQLVVKVLRDHAEFTGGKSGYVIRGPRGDHADYASMNLALHRDLNNAWLGKSDGKGKFTFHNLRHFAGSAWLAQGMRVQNVQWLLGHENITTTMGIYAHQLQEDDHAKQVLATLHAKFPEIVGSLPADASAPPPVMIDAQPLVSTALPSLAPTPAIATAPTFAAAVPEESSAIELPADAPPWMHEALRLMQGGWDLVHVADNVHKDRSTILRNFRKAGLPNPVEIVRAAREAKMKAAYEAGYQALDMAAHGGVSIQTAKNWRIKHEAKIDSKPLEYHGNSSRSRRPVTGKTRGNQLKLL